MGAGKTVLTIISGRRGVDKDILGDSLLRYEVTKLESEGGGSLVSVDDDLGFTTLLVKTIGDGGGGGRLVDDAKDLEAGNCIERGMEISFVARSLHQYVSRNSSTCVNDLRCSTDENLCNHWLQLLFNHNFLTYLDTPPRLAECP